MKNNLIQLCISMLLIFLFFSISSWIIIHYQNPINSIKEALSISVGFLGPLTTMAAAGVAVMLFTDWREIKQYEIKLEYVMVIKKQVQDLLQGIVTDRGLYTKYKNRLRSDNLTESEYRQIYNEILNLENIIVKKMNFISLEINELYYLKYKNTPDPICEEIEKRIIHFDSIGINLQNYGQVWDTRLTTDVLDKYFDYITDELTPFIYDKVMVKYLDDLILK